MGKSAVIAVVAFGIMGTYYTLGMQRNSLETEKRIAEQQYEVLARDAAKAGYQRAKSMLAESFASPASKSFGGEYDGTPYEVKIVNSGESTNLLGISLSESDPDQAKIISVGSAQGPDGEDIRFHIKATFQRAITFPDEVRDYLGYSMLAGGDLKLNGNTDTGIYAEGDSSNRLNANLRTNGALTVKGGASEVKGFGTYMTSASGKLDAFEPNYNPNDDAPVQQVEKAVDIPSLDPDSVDARLSKYYPVENYTGDMKLEKGAAKLENFSTYPGTRDVPFILHVEADGTQPGDLEIVGNVTVEGYSMFIVDGMFDMSSNSSTMKASLSDSYDGPDESSIAVYAAGGMDLSGGAEVWAQILVNGDVTSNTGTPHIYGSVTSSGTTTLGGNPTISYRPASVALSMEGRRQQIKLQTYNEW